MSAGIQCIQSSIFVLRILFLFQMKEMDEWFQKRIEHFREELCAKSEQISIRSVAFLT